MNEQELQNLLDGLKTPAIDPNAKKRAIELAMKAFDEKVNSHTEQAEKKSGFFGQGFFARRRPTRTHETHGRSRVMNITRSKVLYSSLATFGVALLGIWILYRMPSIGFTEKGDVESITSIASLRSPGNLNPSELESEGEDAAVNYKSKLQPTAADARSPSEPESLVESAAALSESRVDKGQFMRQSERLDSAAEKPLPAERTVAHPVSPPALAAKAPAKKLADLQALGGRVQAESKPASQPHAARSILVAPEDAVNPAYYRDEGRDRFENFEINPVKLVAEEPVSTFSVDVDTASYSFVRRQLNKGLLPQKDAVRIEELINYFDYAYPLPESRQVPFKPSIAVTDSPWNPGKKLLHIGIKGYEINAQNKPRTNLVFLLDVSGSMNSPDKLPLVKQSMALLLSSLRPDDTVGIVVYAGAAGKILDPTLVKDKEKILEALNRLQAGGSTAGAQGIKLAYQLAEANFDKQAINRIVLATDGDFNVGITNPNELQGFVERKKDQGIFLSVLGFGEGNYHDRMMQQLAQNGNGVAAYIDTLSEAQKILVDEATSTLFPIAKDVKIQVEFNPATVAEYRLLGYETRALKREDFNNDAVDAGDIGAGHTVTAIYEITPQGSNARLIGDSRYAEKSEAPNNASKDEYAFLKIRYKLPDATHSRLITLPIAARNTDTLDKRLALEFEFSNAVAGFAQLLKGGRYTGKLTYDEVTEQARRSKGEDLFGYRAEFIQLVRKAKVAAGM